MFLQNQWVTEAVFRVLDDEQVKSRRGRFTLTDCDRLWSDQLGSDQGYADKDVELRALMVRFDLCYRLPDTDPDLHEETWLVPQHLSPSKPPALSDWDQPGDLVLTYRYQFLPKGLVSRLMVRMHRFVKRPDLCWSSGALFEHEGTQVLVETSGQGNEITLRSRGPEGTAERHRRRPGRPERRLPGTRGQGRQMGTLHLRHLYQDHNARVFRAQELAEAQARSQADD